MPLLAQLGDLFPTWLWYLLLYGGMAAPAAGLILSAILFPRARARVNSSPIWFFYLIAAPLCYLVISDTNFASLTCAFFALMPAGFILGLIALIPPAKPRDETRFVHGFPVTLKDPNEEGPQE
jgi:hypothetical protein